MRKIHLKYKFTIALITIVMFMACSSTANLDASVVTPQTTTGTTDTAPQVKSTSNKPLTWQTVQTFTGNGTKKTATFHVPDHWRMIWTCNPSSYDGISYNLAVSVEGRDGSDVDLGAVNTLCKTDNIQDNTEEYSGGNVYLNVLSESYWQIQVQVQQ